MISEEIAKHIPIKTMDFQTPKDVCGFMASLIPDWCRTTLEPTPGLGYLKQAAERKGLHVTAPEDYFLLDTDKKFDSVIMNPPFSSKYANLENAKGDYTKYGMRLGYHILKECMDKTDNVIALMPMFTISDSDVRSRYIHSYGLKSLTVLPRSTFQYARIQTVVIELERGYNRPAIFSFYEQIKQRNPSLFDNLK